MLAAQAEQIPGYSLLSAVLGRNVLTGAEVPRTPVTLVSGLAGLIPGGRAAFDNLQRAGVLQRASDWITGELPRLGLTWETIRGLFTRVWNSLGPSDLLNPTGLWDRIVAIFTPSVAAPARLFAVAAGPKLLEILFEGVMTLAGGDGAQVMGLIRVPAAS